MNLFSKSLAATMLMTMSAVAFAHASLQTATPKSGEILTMAPKEIVLRFNEALEPPFSKITLKDRRGVVVKTDKATVDKAHPETLHLVTPKLGAGTYQVQWSTMTQDGHRAKDQYSFQVK